MTQLAIISESTGDIVTRQLAYDSIRRAFEVNASEAGRIELADF
jgi:hypothetical protein